MNLSNHKPSCMSDYDRRDLVKVWEDTVRMFNGRPSLKKKEWSEASDIYELDEMPMPEQEHTPIIDVQNMDTLNMAITYLDMGLNPVILNMASDKTPGGGVARGATAQEEEIFRRTNGHLLLTPNFYPMAKNDIIYSPRLTVVKDSRDNKYQNLKNEKVVGMISCAALRNPRLQDGEYDEEDSELMRAKIEAIVKLGIGYKHDSIVLGAFGCGAFNNPPELVAKYFKEAVDKYGKYYKRIGFAVLVTKPKDIDNFSAFSETFTK